MGTQTRPSPPLLGPGLAPDERARRPLRDRLDALERLEDEDLIGHVGCGEEEVEELSVAPAAARTPELPIAAADRNVARAIPRERHATLFATGMPTLDFSPLEARLSQRQLLPQRRV